MSALPPIADIRQRIEHVCFVLQADIAHTPNTIRCRALVRRLGVVRRRAQLLLVNWETARAKLVKLASKAHIFDTGPPDVGADGRDYRANSVHAPFPDKSQHAERPLAGRGQPPRNPRGTIMNAVYNPEVAADKAHERYPKGNGQFEALTLDTAFPETARVFAEKTVAQTREVYDRSKDALEAAVDTMEKSFDAAGQGAVALNRKIIDIAQRNVNSGFDLANSLAGAKNLAEMMELQGAYWRKQFGALAAQAEEVRALSTKVTADTAEPVKAHVTSSMEELRK